MVEAEKLRVALPLQAEELRIVHRDVVRKIIPDLEKLRMTLTRKTPMGEVVANVGAREVVDGAVGGVEPRNKLKWLSSMCPCLTER